jgi:DNA-binding CsgD family transcriptional regulator
MDPAQPKWIAAELLELAGGAGSLAHWRGVALRDLSSRFGFEDAFWGMPPGSRTIDDQAQLHVGAVDPRRWKPFSEDPSKYRIDRAMTITRGLGGVGIDTEMMSSRELDRSPLYADILRPAGIATTMTVLPCFRGVVTSCIGFARQGRGARFRPADRHLMLALVNGIGAIEVALRICTHGIRPASDATGELSKRERQVASLVASGMSNKEVAALLGTSANTIRKQVAEVYRKLGIRGRVELARTFRATPF